MPYPAEYQRATDEFSAFLQDVRSIAMYGSSHQAYTTAQAVLQVFRRRLSLADAIRFAQVLPVGLRALFVADWDPSEPRQAFGARDEMTSELRWLRPDHNFSDEHSIRDVAQALRKHVDETRLDELLAGLPTGAAEFWSR
jgi:uncharacterized protein (DUF2267 family)